MKQCANTNCLKYHNKPGKFCSRSCANSRQWSAESKEKRSVALKKHIAENPEWKVNQLAALDRRVQTQKETIYKKNLAKFLAGEISDRACLKRWLVETRGDICELCHCTPEWQGKYLSLQVHHLHGPKQNKPKDLQLVCPNCHSQTESFAGKKKM